MKDILIILRAILYLFLGSCLIAYVEVGVLTYEMLLGILDFLPYMIPLVCMYYFYNKIKDK